MVSKRDQAPVGNQSLRLYVPEIFSSEMSPIKFAIIFFVHETIPVSLCVLHRNIQYNYMAMLFES